MTQLLPAGGSVWSRLFAGSGHFPVVEPAAAWRSLFLEFLGAAR